MVLDRTARAVALLVLVLVSGRTGAVSCSLVMASALASLDGHGMRVSRFRNGRLANRESADRRLQKHDLGQS